MSKKIDNILDKDGRYVTTVQNDVMVCVSRRERYLPEDSLEDDEIVLSYHQGEMPAFNTEVLIASDLETRMREIQPDLRRWVEWKG